jgi:hypothetical protein
MDSRTIAPQTGADITPVPLGGSRAQALNRLQVGLSLLLGIVLIVGLANVIEQRAQQSDEAVVPEAAATVAPSEEASGTDPLADAGVVPDLPDEPAAAAPGMNKPPQGIDAAQ